MKALTIIAKETCEERINIFVSEKLTSLRKLSDFNPRNYGFEKLLQLIRSPGLFEMDEKESGRRKIKPVYDK